MLDSGRVSSVVTGSGGDANDSIAVRMRRSLTEGTSWLGSRPLNDPGRIFAEFRDELTSAISAALGSGRWLAGPRIEAFAASFHRYVGDQAIAFL